jgi:hypothetical protein
MDWLVQREEINELLKMRGQGSVVEVRPCRGNVRILPSTT